MSAPSFTELAVLTMAAYLIGGLPFGFWFVRMRLGKDIRTMGSGNIGATNVHRTAGGKAGVIVLLLDIAKGVLAVWLAAAISANDSTAVALAAFAVVLGHCFPVFLRFKGGKAVACFIGAFGFISPLSLLIAAVFFFAAAFLTRFVSLASITGAALFPLIFWRVAHPGPALLWSCVMCGILIIWRHQANIGRLLAGTENVFTWKKKTL